MNDSAAVWGRRERDDNRVGTPQKERSKDLRRDGLGRYKQNHEKGPERMGDSAHQAGVGEGYYSSSLPQFGSSSHRHYTLRPVISSSQDPKLWSELWVTRRERRKRGQRGHSLLGGAPHSRRAHPTPARVAFSLVSPTSTQRPQKAPYPARHGAQPQDAPHLHNVTRAADTDKMETAPFSPFRDYLLFARHFRHRAQPAPQPRVTSFQARVG